MKLILHIGLQKTGTSSVQVMLASSAEALAEQGMVYPALPSPRQPRSGVWTSPFRHNCIAGTYADFNSVFEIMTAAEAAVFWHDLRRGGRTPILSAEEFSRQRDFTSLKAALDGFEVEVVVYLRRQDRYVESLYNQQNKILVQRGDQSLMSEGFLTTPDLDHFVRRSGYRGILDYADLLHRVETQLTPARIHVRHFDRAAMRGSDVCSDFCDAIGLDPGLMHRPRQEANQSIRNDVLHQWKAAFMTGGPDAGAAFLRDLNAMIAVGEDMSGSYTILSEEERAALIGEYAAVNAAVRDHYGVDLDRPGGPTV
ncbi:hypothetical protein [Loktanella sp. M215]|uniref:hypothetical protein n=1 Tax=Loktanella sp. M215 TaxID=2675431 RepID=UPI001F3C2753|nr:hypothetical protein [Loktanella sp. M215]MCF7702154.1 hypothetical protein [Loktanella sp. M215]